MVLPEELFLSRPHLGCLRTWITLLRSAEAEQVFRVKKRRRFVPSSVTAASRYRSRSLDRDPAVALGCVRGDPFIGSAKAEGTSI